MGTGVSQCGADDLGKLRRGSQIGSGSVTEATRGLHCASGAGSPVPPALGAPSRGPSAASFVRALPPSRQPGGSPASLAPPPPAGGSFVAVESALSGPFLFAASGAACCRRPWSSREKVLSVNTKPRRRTAHSPPPPVLRNSVPGTYHGPCGCLHTFMHMMVPRGAPTVPWAGPRSSRFTEAFAVRSPGPLCVGDSPQRPHSGMPAPSPWGDSNLNISEAL